MSYRKISQSRGHGIRSLNYRIILKLLTRSATAVLQKCQTKLMQSTNSKYASQDYNSNRCLMIMRRVIAINIDTGCICMRHFPCILVPFVSPLRWRHNGRDNVSNHQSHHCLLNRLFRRRSKKTSKLRVTVEFPAQMASNAEDVSIWWRHHVTLCNLITTDCLYPSPVDECHIH